MELRWSGLLLMHFSLLIVVHECLNHLGSDDVMFLNAPEEPVSRYPLRVLYSCSKTAVVHLEVLVSFDTGLASTVFQRHWSCKPGTSRVRVLSLILPDWLVYQADWRIQDSDWVLTSFLRAWLSRDESLGRYRSALAHAMVPLKLQYPLSRPLKQHQLCPSWATEILWGTRRATISKCPKEREVASFLSSVYASTGESFGVTRTLISYGNEALERLRLKAISYPWCAFSIWLFLVQPCKQHLCGVLHHIDSKHNYATPALFLTNSGQLHTQMHGESGVSSAFISQFKVPLGQWCRINMELKGSMVKVAMACMDGQQHIVEHTFRIAVQLDDTDGYFVVGGGQFIQGIEGYYGPALYYRNRLLSDSESEVHIPHPVRVVNLTGWFQSCQEFQSELYIKMMKYSLRARERGISESCMDVYSEWALQNDPFSIRAQCESWEAPSVPQRRLAVQLAAKLAKKKGTADPAAVGRALYSLALRKLAQAVDAGVVGRMVPLLLQAGCLGENRALHLSSVLLSSGLGVRRQAEKAWLLTLLAAQKDWRLALLRLGHLHHVGEQDVTPDLDLAYAYYSNIAKQTSADHHNPSPQQVFVESIYLNNEEVLSHQTNEDDDLFHWLKLQARNGAPDAEQAMGRMLFWGQQGVAPDIQTAVRHYERGATRLEDPVSMYDYAIVLLMGQGVTKDVPRAVTFLKKAMEQGFAPAFNALGWYYEQFEQDYERAVQLWERADALGSSDAAMNLGVMHSQGLYPGKPADEFKAYTYYLKSAQRGNLGGGIQLASLWSQGIPGHVTRRPLEAVLWVKWASEQNGYLGAVLRKALNAYLKEDWLTALIYYMMAAESGFSAAQFNVAYICERNPGGFLDPTFVRQCMWRYYNLTIQSEDPAPYALIKMGDLFCDDHALSKRDVAAAAEMYKNAALKNDPQGWYSLGLLVQEGEKLPVSLLFELDLLQPHLSDRHELLTTLYRRCRDSNGTDAYVPCSLALFHAQLRPFQKVGGATIKLSSAVAVAVATLPILFIIPGFLRRRAAPPGQNS